MPNIDPVKKAEKIMRDHQRVLVPNPVAAGQRTMDKTQAPVKPLQAIKRPVNNAIKKTANRSDLFGGAVKAASTAMKAFTDANKGPRRTFREYYEELHSK